MYSAYKLNKQGDNIQPWCTLYLLGIKYFKLCHTFEIYLHYILPWWLRQWSICLQCRRPRFDPWVRKILCRRKRQPTPVLFPGKSHGRRTLVGHSPWGRKELDTTERLHFLSFLSLYYIACESIQVHVQPQPYFPVNPVIPNWQNHIMQPGASLVALAVKKQPANAGDMWHVGLIPGSGRSPGGGHDNPLPYSCLENPMDRGARQATVHRVSESRIWLKWLGMHIPFYRGNDYSWWKMFFIEFQLINEEEMICDHWSKC